MNTPMDDKAREAFEREYEAYRLPAEADWFRREEDDPDAYYHATTADAWWGFQAALQWAASQQAAEGWRPIETAPKDEVGALGRHHHAAKVLVFAGGEVVRARWWWHDDGSSSFIMDGGRPCSPTHWMPLPAAPTAQGGADADQA